MKYLFILNDPPYGTERSYNGLRLARQLLQEKDVDNHIKVFLTGDAATCAKRGQKVPQGYYHIESLLKMLVKHGAEVGICGTCLDARGIADVELVEGTQRGNMAELAAWTAWADKILVF